MFITNRLLWRGTLFRTRPDTRKGSGIMGHGVRIQELPGIGRRYDIDLGRPDRRLSVVVRREGVRDLYVFTSSASEPTAVLELTEEQARKLSAVLGETFFEG